MGSKKITVAGFASILLVAAVAASSESHHQTSSHPHHDSPFSKAVTAICSATDYHEACIKSLLGAKNSNPKHLIQVAFESAAEDLQQAIHNSSLYKSAHNDVRTKGALKVCDEVLNRSISDLRRSFDKIKEFDLSSVDDYVDDVRTWLSASITFHETCIDAFENTTGDTGEKMKKVLKSSGELLSNVLAMVTDFSKILSSLLFGGFGGFSGRRLLGEEAATNFNTGDGEFPAFVEGHSRKLLADTAATVTPNAVVALDGSGQFKTIGEAVATIPPKNNQPFVILVKAGIYKELVKIPKGANNVLLLGEGQLKTRISGSLNFIAGVQTFDTATLAVDADDFMAKDIGIENTAGPSGHQACAVRVSGDRAIFFQVQMDGYQDTLYAHSYHHFYRDCVISGTIDFIFGDAVAVFQKCKFVVRKPMENQGCMVTAEGRKTRSSVGMIMIQNCDFVAEDALLSATPKVQVYLGRPWKEFSTTIIMQSNIEGFIDPTGWAVWSGTFALDTLYYGEYSNRGPGSDTTKRVTWKGIQKITPELALTFTPEKLLLPSDEWVKKSGVPYVGGMMQV